MKSDQVRVKVVYRKSKRKHVLRWEDPETGVVREKAAVESRKESEKLAAQLEADLREGRYVAPSKLLWEDFRLAFESDKLPSLAAKSRNSYASALNHVERIIRPSRLAEVDAVALSRLQAKLRTDGRRESTIATHLRHIRAALSWAQDLGMLREVPRVAMPQRARKQRQMRGRPITREEFERMLAACDEVRPADSSLWKALLEGLWLSGLRLGEALHLGWELDDPISVDLSGKYPCLRITAEAEKGFQDRQLPITPDFAEVLMATPVDERAGKVFGVAARNMRLDFVSKIITRIGKAGRVVVNKEQGKYASAHDLRRAFGTRWAGKVQPATLRELMRHASIETTLRFYVQRRVADIAEEIAQVSRSRPANSTYFPLDQGTPETMGGYGNGESRGD